MSPSKFVKSVVPVESTEPGVFLPSERGIGLIINGHIVDMGHAGNYASSKRQASGHISSKYGTGKSIFTGIGQLQGMVLILGDHQREQGAEGFFAYEFMIAIDVAE
ncbi:hypothetical protein D3C87_1455550 [compost metagenome]|jgi:hypothetical protein